MAGINLGNASSISVSNLASIATVLAGGSSRQNIPFSMTLNMDVTNPNTAAAFLDALDYTILINEMEFATGKWIFLSALNRERQRWYLYLLVST